MRPATMTFQEGLKREGLLFARAGEGVNPAFAEFSGLEKQSAGVQANRTAGKRRARSGIGTVMVLVLSWLALFFEGRELSPEQGDRETRLLMRLFGRPQSRWPGAMKALFCWAAAVGFCLCLAWLC